MSLNIKDARVHALARRAAEVTGKSQTRAVEEALERLLAAYDVDPDRDRVQATIDVVRGIAAEYQADMGREDRVVRTPEDLFDSATGLPR